jgi:hypothetical protein
LESVLSKGKEKTKFLMMRIPRQEIPDRGFFIWGNRRHRFVYLPDAGYYNPIQGDDYIYWYLRSFLFVPSIIICYNATRLLHIEKNNTEKFVMKFVTEYKGWRKIGTFGVFSFKFESCHSD